MMDQRLIQRTRHVLQRRARRTQTCSDARFEDACAHLVRWVDAHPVLSGVGAKLRAAGARIAPDLLRSFDAGVVDSGERTEKEVAQLFARGEEGVEPTRYFASTAFDHAALCMVAVDAFAKSANGGEGARQFACEHAAWHFRGRRLTGDEIMRQCRAVVDDLYEYLDEQLDARNAIYGILSKYKQRCENFRRKRLRAIAESGLEDVHPGERALAMELYEYVFDQGAEFHVEPVSGSGEVDLLLTEPEGRYLVVDAKYVSPDDEASRIRKKVVDGFHGPGGADQISQVRVHPGGGRHKGRYVNISTGEGKIKIVDKSYKADANEKARFIRVDD